ncbi:GMC oxidoreductase [Microbacterium sp. YY-01]|uniref:GMC oxidoreductase n=1 Tax=Microbacterium sp. YY-01 TaxID=3421634 RepID=UPI003D17E911
MSIAIIGSGYGGAVAAYRLASQGITVDLIEMGKDWDATAAPGKVFPSMLSPDGRSFWFENRTILPYRYFFGLDVVNRTIPSRAGVLAVEKFAHMQVYAGRGLGGGSLVNGGMAVVPPRSFFHQVLPDVDVDEMYGTYFPRAQERLRVRSISRDIVHYSPYYSFARAATEHNSAAGYDTVDVPNVYDPNYLRMESFGRVSRSATGGEVIYGNNHGKNSLTRTYLQAALATGRVRVSTMTEVTRLRRAASGTYTLSLREIVDDGTVVAESERTYDRVILAAGSVGTARLLLRAQAEGDLTGLDDSLGHGWGPNGNTMVMRQVPGAVGAHQSTIPVRALDAWDDTDASVFAEIAPLPVGIETRALGYLAITNNPNQAQYSIDASGTLALSWTPDMHAPSITAARAVIDRLNQVNGGSTLTTMLDGGKAYSDHFTYHPLGGAVLGQTTDMNGELHGAPGLFVIDGSLIPAKIGVNPFVTITALAERIMDKLIAAGRFS